MAFAVPCVTEGAQVEGAVVLSQPGAHGAVQLPHEGLEVVEVTVHGAGEAPEPWQHVHDAARVRLPGVLAAAQHQQP